MNDYPKVRVMAGYGLLGGLVGSILVLAFLLMIAWLRNGQSPIFIICR